MRPRRGGMILEDTRAAALPGGDRATSLDLYHRA
jgi:hypothetical protein